jgi:hypothetical protein
MSGAEGGSQQQTERLWGEIEERLAMFWEQNEERLTEEIAMRGLGKSVFDLLRALEEIPATEKVRLFRLANPDFEPLDVDGASGEAIALGILRMLEAWER